MVVSYFFCFIVYINIKTITMNPNEKLIKNMERYELSQESPINKFARIMYEIAGEEKKDIVKEIINTLKPKQNGKRN